MAKGRAPHTSRWSRRTAEPSFRRGISGFPPRNIAWNAGLLVRQHTSKHSSPRLWEYLDGLSAELRPWLIRGDVGFGNEPVMREAELRRQPYLFKLRVTKGVKRAIERAMGERDWQDAGARWQGKDGRLRLEGWSRHRRIVILRRRTERSLALTERDGHGQLRLGFAEIDDGREVWEYAVLVTSLDSESGHGKAQLI
jgi:hypothetical protein